MAYGIALFTLVGVTGLASHTILDQFAVERVNFEFYSLGWKIPFILTMVLNVCKLLRLPKTDHNQD